MTTPLDDKELETAIMWAIVGDNPVEYSADGRRRADNLIKVITTKKAEWEKELLLKLGKGDPQNPLVYAARIAQELSRIERSQEEI